VQALRVSGPAAAALATQDRGSHLMLRHAVGLRPHRRVLLKLAAMAPLAFALRTAAAGSPGARRPAKRGYRLTRHIRTAYRLARF